MKKKAPWRVGGKRGEKERTVKRIDVFFIKKKFTE